MRLIHVLLAFSLLDAATGVATATTLVRSKTETIAAAADRAIHGTVVAKEARWLDGRIVTRVYLRGDEPQPWFDCPGGTVDGVTMAVIGMPEFQLGEDVVVLVATRRGRQRLIGLSEGKLAVVAGPAGPQVLLRLDDDGPLTPVALDDGVARLRRVVDAAARRRHP